MNWTLNHWLLFVAFFTTLLFLGLTLKIGDKWQDTVNRCHHAPLKPQADTYCAIQCANLAGLLVSGLVFLWELI